MTHGCLTCAKESQRRIQCGLLHYLRYLKATIFENEGAVQGISFILFTVACEVGYRYSRKMRYNLIYGSRSLWNSQLDQQSLGTRAAMLLICWPVCDTGDNFTAKSE